jgi:hypothetical protein
MSKFNQIAEMYSWAIFRVIELCYSQNVTTTWRDIYIFLRIPPLLWNDDSDLDEKIYVQNDEELEMFRSLLQSKHSTIH